MNYIRHSARRRQHSQSSQSRKFEISFLTGSRLFGDRLFFFFLSFFSFFSFFFVLKPFLYRTSPRWLVVSFYYISRVWRDFVSVIPSVLVALVAIYIFSSHPSD